MRKLAAGNSLVGILVAFLIVVIGVVFLTTGGLGLIKNEKGENYERPDKLGQTTLGRARYAAEDTVCRQQLGQVRGMIQVEMEPADEVYPSSLTDLRLPKDYDKCPIGKEPYEYDSATGKLKCVHPGHEKY